MSFSRLPEIQKFTAVPSFYLQFTVYKALKTTKSLPERMPHIEPTPSTRLEVSWLFINIELNSCSSLCYFQQLQESQ